ncbi:MAG: hypothetical protein ACI8XO_004016 [Verrucomicrobiales bacterium]
MSKEERSQEEDTPFAISELPLPATMQALNITDGQINAKIRKNKTRITFSDVQIKISKIDLDPNDLKNHNQAKVSIKGHLDIEDRDRTTKYADLDIQSEGDVIPFDPVTGYINPDLTYEITVLKGSKLETIPSLVKLAGKVKELNELGLKLDALADSVTFEKDTSVTLGYRDHTLTIADKAEIEFNGHLLTVHQGAWLHTGSNEHEAEAEVMLSEPASETALANAREFLTDKLPVDKEVVLKYTEKLLAPVIRDGRIFVPFTSKGDLNDPKVRPEVDLKSVAETLALEALGDILDKAQDDAGK